jgi:hypothetical protein
VWIDCGRREATWRGFRGAGLVLAALAAALVPAGCGGAEPPPADPAPVRLSIAAPADGTVVRERSVEVRGRVSPARAEVRVHGRDAPVAGGSFTSTVELDEGVNVIDVSASMAGRSTAFAVVRVTQDPHVVVPDLSGVPEEEAADRLSQLGLDPSLDRIGGFFDDLRSGERRVCASDPRPGSRLLPGEEVVLAVAKRC